MAKAKKLASGSWRVQVYSHTETVSDPLTGRVKEKRIYRSFTSDDPSPAGRRKAEAAAAEFALHKETEKVSKIYTLKEAMEKYCEAKENVLSPSTIRAYKSMTRNAYSDIISKRTDHLSNLDIQKAMNALAKEHSPKYVRNAYGFLTAVLALYQPDFSPQSKLPQSVHPDTYTPSDAEIARLIEFFKMNDTEMLKAVYLGAFGTLRRSEVCAALAEDIHDGRLLIHQAVVKNSDGIWEVKTTKTYSSTRYVDIPEFALAYFPESGNIVNLTPSALTARFKRALKVLNLPPFRFHDLRHYAASIMHALGVPDQYIMQQGGWQSDNVLKGIYRNALPDYQKKFLNITTDHFSKINDGEMQHESQNNQKLCNTKCNTKRKKPLKQGQKHCG